MASNIHSNEEWLFELSVEYSQNNPETFPLIPPHFGHSAASLPSPQSFVREQKDNTLGFMGIMSAIL